MTIVSSAMDFAQTAGLKGDVGLNLKFPDLEEKLRSVFLQRTGDLDLSSVGLTCKYCGKACVSTLLFGSQRLIASRGEVPLDFVRFLQGSEHQIGPGFIGDKRQESEVVGHLAFESHLDSAEDV